MNLNKLLVRSLAVTFILMLCGAVASHILWREAPLKGSGSSSFLFIAGGLIFLTTERRCLLPLCVTGVIGFFAEVIGVQYGWLFGRYYYTEILAPSFLEVPIVMFCAWVVLFAYVKNMMVFPRLPVWIEIVLSSVWMTALDLVIDPIAAHPFDFWRWVDSSPYYGIPYRNFLGWFVVSILIFTTTRLISMPQPLANHWARMVGFGIIILYTLAAMVYGYFLVVFIGATLVIVHMGILGAINRTVSLRSMQKPLAN